MHIRRLAALLSILMILMLASNNFSLALNDDCNNVSVIFIRGSGQNGKSEFIDKPLSEDFKKAEPQSYAFFDGINKRTPNVSKEFISFHNQGGHKYGYRALGAESFLSKAEHNTSTTIRSNAYYESMYDGSDALVQYLKSKIVNCPNQKIILGGYSQGAQVVGESLPRLTSLERSKIAFTALYGDPKFNTKDNTSLYKKGPWVRGNAFSLSTGILGARVQYLPDDMRGKAGSWCDFGDTICTGRNFNDPIGRIIGEKYIEAVHSNYYQEKWMPRSMNEIVGSIGAMDVYNKNPDPANMNMYYRKNGTRPYTDIVLVIDSAGSNEKGIEKLRQDAGAISKSLLKDKNTQVGIVRYSNQTPGIFGSTPTLGWEPNTTYGPTSVQWQLEQNLKSIFTDPATSAWDYTPMYAGLNKANEVMERIARPGAQKQYIVYTNKYPGGPFAGGVDIYARQGKTFVSKEQILRKMYTLDPVIANVVVVPDNKTGLFDAKENLESIVGLTNGFVQTSDLTGVAAAFDKTANEFDTSPVAVIGETFQQGSQLFVNGGDSYDPNSFITKYRWDCNDDGLYELEDSQPTAICEYGADYNGIIGLEVESADGQRAKMYKQVSVITQNLSIQNIDLNISKNNLLGNIFEYSLLNDNLGQHLYAVYDDEGNTLDSTDTNKLVVDSDNVVGDFVVFKLLIDCQEVGSTRMQIKNFPPPKQEANEDKNDQNISNNVISEEDYLAAKNLGDISEKALTLPNDSSVQSTIVLAAQSPSVSAPSSAVALGGYSENNNFDTTSSNDTSGSATVLTDSANTQTSSAKDEKSEVLGDSIVKKSNLPGFIYFMIGFISLVTLLLFVIKKANSKLDRI
jgi:hypothetical protein